MHDQYEGNIKIMTCFVLIVPGQAKALSCVSLQDDVCHVGVKESCKPDNTKNILATQLIHSWDPREVMVALAEGY